MDIGLILTHDCNLACRYCYAGAKFPRQMPEQVAVRALELGLTGESARIIVSFFGGEPFLAFDRMQRYTRLAREILAGEGRRLVFTTTTNATLVTPEKVAFLKEHDFYLGVSIDGVQEAHDAARPTRGGTGSYSQVLEGVHQLLESGVRFKTISVVDPVNVRYLARTARFLIGEGVRRMSFSPNYDADWSDQELDLLQSGYREIAEIYVDRFRQGELVHINVIEEKIITHLKEGYDQTDRCDFGKNSIAVAPSGNIYPCERLVGEDRDTTLCIGNVTQGFTPRRSELLACTGNHNSECEGCALIDRCMSWCPCANLADTGWLDRPGGLVCRHEKAAVAAADWAASTLYQEGNSLFLNYFYGRRHTGGQKQKQ